MIVLETERLRLRWLTTDDAEFILGLLNDPAWIRFIGDKGVRTLEAAKNYILTGPMDMYSRLGFGLFLTVLKEEKIPIGICGLIKRDSLEHVDIGYAFLPEYRSKGYAFEAATATLAYGREKLGLTRIVAITSKDNSDSAKLLEKIGLKFERMIQLSNDHEVLKLFSVDFK